MKIHNWLERSGFRTGTFFAKTALVLFCPMAGLMAHAQQYTDLHYISGSVEDISHIFDGIAYGSNFSGELTVEATSLLGDREITLDELYSLNLEMAGICISSNAQDCKSLTYFAEITSIDAVSMTLPSGYEGFLQGGFTITMQFYYLEFEYFLAQLSVDLSQGTFLLTSVDPDVPATMSGSAQIHVYTDSDFDGRIDSFDNCVVATNPSQMDTDQDGFGDACDQDFNNDCRVNFLDLALFASYVGTSDPLYDLTGDGTVNLLDYALVTSRFGYSPGPSAYGLDVLETCF